MGAKNSRNMPRATALPDSYVSKGPWKCSVCTKMYEAPEDMPVLDHDDVTLLCRLCCTEQDAEGSVVALEAGMPSYVDKQFRNGTWACLSFKPADVVTPGGRQHVKEIMIAFMMQEDDEMVLIRKGIEMVLQKKPPSQIKKERIRGLRQQLQMKKELAEEKKKLAREKKKHSSHHGRKSNRGFQPPKEEVQEDAVQPPATTIIDSA